ncbi:MAG: urease accessory protein UreE [Elainellaceae cyanobacterium]
MPTVLTHRLENQPPLPAQNSLSLTADERTRSRHRFTAAGLDLQLQLPRGTVLRHGDILSSANGQYFVRVVAEPEPVLVVTGSALDLMRAAYHLGNRHVPVEVSEPCLRLAPDPVLRSLLLSLGLTVTDAVAPFHPESGAYGHGGHTHEATPTGTERHDIEPRHD